MLSASLLSLFFLLAAVGAAEGQTIPAVIGRDVTLPCSAKGYTPLEQMEWSRPGTHLQYVVIFRNQSQDLEIPEQRYEGRVELEDLQKGDVSLVLKNVTAEDRGIYECYVLKKGRRKRAIQPVSTVYLDVHYPPLMRAYITAFVAACVVMTVSLMAVALIRGKKINNYRSSPQDEA